MARPLTLAFCAAAAALAGEAHALDPRLAITQYRQDVWQEGLPQFSIHDITQTPDGYLWLATQAGLARFNGSRFAVFDTRNTPALRTNVIWALHPDRAGNLWIGTVTGGLVRYRDGEFTAFTTRDGLASDIVYTLEEDRAGALWIGDQRRAVALPGRPLQHVRAARAQEREGPPPRRRGPAVDRHGRRRPLLPAGRRPHPLHEEGRARSDRIRAVYADRKGRVWIGTDESGLDLLEGGALHASRLPRASRATPSATIVEDRDGNVWVGTFGGGLERFSDERVDHYGTAEGLPERHRVLAVRGPRGQPLDRHGRRRAGAAARHQAAAAHRGARACRPT